MNTAITITLIICVALVALSLINRRNEERARTQGTPRLPLRDLHGLW